MAKFCGCGGKFICDRCGTEYKSGILTCWRNVPMTNAKKSIKSYDADMKKDNDRQLYWKLKDIVRNKSPVEVFSVNQIENILGVGYATYGEKIRIALDYLICNGIVRKVVFDVADDIKAGQKRIGRGHRYQKTEEPPCEWMKTDSNNFFKCDYPNTIWKAKK